MCFPPFRFFPLFFCGFHYPFLNAINLKRTCLLGFQTSGCALASRKTPPLVLSTQPLTFALDQFHLEFAQTLSVDATSLSSCLIYDLLVGGVSQVSLRGLLLFGAFTSFKIFGSLAPYKTKMKGGR